MRAFHETLDSIGLDIAKLHRLCFDRHSDQTAPQDQIISSIVNSGVDVDKLSYLLLDGHFTGVAYAGGLDLSNLLTSASIVQLQNGRLHLAFNDRALQAVEHVFLTRLWNFRSIYWHHTNRALMAMVGRCIAAVFAVGDPLLQFTEYFDASLATGESGALQWLAARCGSLKIPERSLVETLALNRGDLYKRLYVVRPEKDSDDATLYDDLGTRLKPLRGIEYLDADRKFCASVAGGLTRLLRSAGVDTEVGETEVLVDLPRRKLDTGGDAYIVTDAGPIAVRDASSVIGHIQEDYDRMAKRVRVFVSPRVAALTEDLRRAKRGAIGDIVKAAVGVLPARPRGAG